MTGIVVFILILATAFVSYKGFKSYSFFHKNSFQVERILGYKEYLRIVTSGFLHGSWMHLLFNMISLYAFSGTLLDHVGTWKFLALYLTGLTGGNLFALYIYRHRGSYTAVGASGAVCSIIFSAIALFPGMHIQLFLLPVNIPGWLFGFLYILITLYGMRSRTDNIGHEAHFGGALTGLLLTLVLYPDALRYNYFTIALIILPCVYFLYQIIKNPHGLMMGSFSETEKFQTLEDRYNASKKQKQEELDNILEKIHKDGIDSLTREERNRLDKLARKG